MNKKEFYKLVITLFLLLITMYSNAQKFAWADRLVTTGKKAQSIMNNLQANDAGDVFILQKFGTVTDKGDDVFCDHTTFMGKKFYGAKYGKSGGNSYNGNLLITKSNTAGELIWAVHTDAGDIYTSASVMIPTADGGCFLALKARNSDKNAYLDSLLIRTVSNNGDKDSIKWVAEFNDNEYHSVYQPVFVKVSGSGIVTMLKKADVDYSAMPNATYYSYGTPNGFDFYGGDQDSDGNVYVGGRIRKAMNFGGGQRITPHNTTEWNGGPQQPCGNLFVLKMDENGNYIKHFTSDPTNAITFDNVKHIKIESDALYVVGNVRGKGGNKFNIGTFEMIPNDFQSAYAMKLNKELNTVAWAEYYPFVKVHNRKDWKLLNMTMDKDEFYIVGGNTGGIAHADKPEVALAQSGSNWLNGFLLKCSKTDGKIVNTTFEQGTYIGQAFAAITAPDSVYLYGYDWGNAATYDKWYIYLRAFSKTDLTPGKRYSLMNQYGMPTAWGAVAVGDRLITINRMGKNKPFTFHGTETSFTAPLWSGVVAAWDFPGYDFNKNVATDMAPIDIQPSNIIVLTNGLRLTIKNAPKNEVVYVYNMTGQCIASSISSDKTTPIIIDIPQVGVYIIRTKETAQKVIVQ